MRRLTTLSRSTPSVASPAARELVSSLTSPKDRRRFVHHQEGRVGLPLPLPGCLTRRRDANRYVRPVVFERVRPRMALGGKANALLTPTARSTASWTGDLRNGTSRRRFLGTDGTVSWGRTPLNREYVPSTCRTGRPLAGERRRRLRRRLPVCAAAWRSSSAAEPTMDLGDQRRRRNPTDLRRRPGYRLLRSWLASIPRGRVSSLLNGPVRLPSSSQRGRSVRFRTGRREDTVNLSTSGSDHRVIGEVRAGGERSPTRPS